MSTVGFARKSIPQTKNESGFNGPRCPWPLPIGPAVLARESGVPIYPIFNFREGRFQMRVVIRPPIMVAKTTDRTTDIAEALHRLGSEIEWAIRERPHQWFCFRQLWSDAASRRA